METELYKGYTIKIEQDELGGDCREWDNLGTMVCRHRNYNLGDIQIPESYYNEKLQCDVDIDTAEAIVTWLKQEHGELAVIKPLFLLDHSGITISTGRFGCDAQGWDTSFVGYIFVTRAKVLKEYNIKRINKKLLSNIDTYLTNEVKTYATELEGGVLMYSIEKDGRDINSCGGFYELSHLMEDAKSYIDFDIKEVQEKKEKQLKAYITNSVPLQYRVL